jgi:hypoxanthine phosphoribosyltransferase
MPEHRKRYQVFVSSTYEDLKQERQEIMRALLELDCIPAGMELFPAANESQWTLIKRVIDDCDYYIVIVAGRYGSIGPDGYSYTEMEYRYATDKGKPAIAFLHASPDDLSSKRCEQETERRRLLGNFKALLKEKVCRHWSSPADLGSQVSRSLVNLIRDQPSIGWIRGESVNTSDDGHVMPWHAYWEQLRSIAERIRRIYSDGRYIPEIIVSISNGGGIYGELLTREVFAGRPLAMLWANRLRKDGKYFENDYNMGIVRAIRKTATHSNEVNVLLVDDIIASGNTHAQVFEFFHSHLPIAKVQFLPMFSRNAQYFEVVRDQILWTHPAFGLSESEAHKIHETAWYRLPYGKDIRSS